MKSKLLTLGLTSLFLFGCSSKIKESTYEDLQTKINNEEDFILLLTSKSCAYCKNLKQSIKKSNYNFDIIDISMDDIINGVKNNDDEYIEAYKYLANTIDYSFSNVTSFILEETYQSYFSTVDEVVNYETLYGKDDYIEGYINIVFPISIFYNDGNVINFEIGDYSASLDKAFSKYNEEKDKVKEPINVEEYLTFIKFNELITKRENKEDFILILSSDSCSYCNKQYSDLRAYIPSLPFNFTCLNVDDILISIETDMDNNPIDKDKYEEGKIQYRYLASLIEETWNYQKDTTYIDEFNTDRFGEKEASLVYPVTLMFNDGELVKEFSYLGYGWSKELSAYKAFINMFVSIKDF